MDETETQVLLSVQNKCAGVELVGSSHAESAEELHPAGSPHHMTSHGGVAGVIQEKRTRFSLSHDDGSIGKSLKFCYRHCSTDTFLAVS